MAFSERYVDPALAADSGTGTRATITCTAATFTIGTLNLNETAAFASYTFVSGDEIYVTGGTAVNAGYYTIASKTDDDNIVLTADITSDASSPTDVTAATAPYGDLEYGIEQETFDTTNGTRVNIKAGTDEVVAAELSAAMADTGTSVAWAPAETAPCIFQGYTTAAGDGGIGGISGGAAASVYSDALFDYVFFIDLHCHNTGANWVLNMDNSCGVIRCEVDNSTTGGIDMDQQGIVVESYVHDITGVGINVSSFGAWVENNYLLDGASKKFTLGIGIGAGSAAEKNIINLSGGGNGIQLNHSGKASHNSIYAAATSANGITVLGDTIAGMITNNLIEGFSDTGGSGIKLDGTNNGVFYYGGNAVYNCETAYIAPAAYAIDSIGDNETLTASPFTDAAGGDFSPVDTGNVKEGALPQTFANGNV